jgi:hypothetical protein
MNSHSELVISFEEFLTDPLNEGKDMRDYVNEVLTPSIDDDIDWVLNEIHTIEQWYIDAKEKPRSRETYKAMINDLKALLARKQTKKRG